MNPATDTAARPTRGPVALVLSCLKGVRPEGDGWVGLCPAPGHKDTRPSLRISEGKNRSAVLCCRSGGCRVEEILEAIGLAKKDLFEERPRAGLSLRELAEHKHLDVEFLRREFGLHDIGGVVGIPYKNEAGAVVATKRRTALIAREGSIWVKGRAVMPYGRERLQRARDTGETLWLPEGESDVWSLVHHGRHALGIPGANNAKVLEEADLAGIAHLVVVQEPGQGGITFVRGVATRLRRLSWQGEAVAVRLDGYKDPSDAHMREPDRFDAVLDAALEAAVSLSQAAAAVPTAAPTARGPRARTVCLADIDAREVDWLWPGRLPAGMVALLDGDSGLGKSTIVIDLVARLTRGRPLPNELRVQRDVVDVVILGHEDSPHHTLRPRIDAAGADPKRVHLLTDVGGRMPQLPDDADEIERVIRETGARLLVIDPISAYMGRTDLHRDNEVRDTLNPLVLIAERTHAAVLMLRHLRKAGGTNAIHRGLGSVAFVAVARTAMMLLRDPDDEPARILTWPKLTVARHPASLRWKWIDGEGAPRVTWEGTCDLTADDILSRQDREGRGGGNVGKLHDAEEFLRRELESGPRRATEIEKLAKEAGLSVKGALRRARRSLANAHRDRDGWWWSLRSQDPRTTQEEQPPPAATDAHLAHLAHLKEEQEEQEEQDYRYRESAPLGDQGVDIP